MLLLHNINSMEVMTGIIIKLLTLGYAYPAEELIYGQYSFLVFSYYKICTIKIGREALKASRPIYCFDLNFVNSCQLQL